MAETPLIRRLNEFAGTEGTYLLLSTPPSCPKVARLPTQHDFILSCTNHELVIAPLNNKQRVRVLDCGAADGTWLCDLPNIYPQYDWDLHGIDTGAALFPRERSKQGPNLVELDIRHTVPATLEWEGTFDFIHQRLLIWALPRPEWPGVIERYRTLLKTGGWLQLVEGQWVDRERGFDPVKTPISAKMSVMQRWSTERFGMNIFIADELEDLIKAAGFQNIRKATYPLGYGAEAKEPNCRQQSADMWVDTFRILALKLPPEGIPGVVRDEGEFSNFLDELKLEVLEHGYEPRLNLVTGQR